MKNNNRWVLLVILLLLTVFTGCTKNTVENGPETTVEKETKTDEKVDQIQIVDGVQEVRIQLENRAYAPITVYKDIPVRFIIEAKEENINGCNRSIIIPEYKVQSENFVAGDNVVEFTPTETGKFPYSCWMGMIRSSITVIDQTEGEK